MANIKEIINIPAKGSLCLYELKQHEPWSDEECSRFLDRGEQGNMQVLQDLNQRNVDNLNNTSREAIFSFCGPYIVIYMCNKDRQLAASMIIFYKTPVSSTLLSPSFHFYL